MTDNTSSDPSGDLSLRPIPQEGNNSGSPEDYRVAAGMQATLCTQLITAALTMLTVLAVFFTFILEKRGGGGWFVALAIASFLAFIASIFVGGMALDRFSSFGSKGKWDDDKAKGQFNLQAVFCIGGLILFVLMTIVNGGPKTDDVEQRTRELYMHLDSATVATRRTTDALLRVAEGNANLIRRLDSVLIPKPTTIPKCK